MLDALLSGIQGLADGMRHLGGANIVMIALAGTLFYLAVAKDVEPLLLFAVCRHEAGGGDRHALVDCRLVHRAPPAGALSHVATLRIDVNGPPFREEGR